MKDAHRCKNLLFTGPQLLLCLCFSEDVQKIYPISRSREKKYLQNEILETRGKITFSAYHGARKVLCRPPLLEFVHFHNSSDLDRRLLAIARRGHEIELNERRNEASGSPAGSDCSSGGGGEDDGGGGEGGGGGEDGVLGGGREREGGVRLRSLVRCPVYKNLKPIDSIFLFPTLPTFPVPTIHIHQYMYTCVTMYTCGFLI
jgi:hypothetical protein